MKRVFNKKTLSIVLVFTLVTGIFVGQTVVQGTKSQAKSVKDVAKEALLAKRAQVLRNNLKMNTQASENEVVRAIITLKAKSVADTNNVSEYNSKLKSKEEKIISKQKNLVKEVEKITGNEVVNQTAYLVNSISIDATRAQMKKIAKLEGVDTVYEASTYKTNMATAVDEGNVRNVWNTEEYGYTGEGVVVSIIDTGVNYKHQDMVLDTGVKNKYTKEEWENYIKEAYIKNKHNYVIEGFRKGKVPRAMVEKMYGAAIFYEDAANELIPEAYEKAYDECGEDIVSSPKIDVIQIEKGKPFIFTAEVALKPEVALGKYKGVKVDKIDVEVTDAEIEAEINTERENSARTIPVTDRAVKDGDMTVAKYIESVAKAEGCELDIVKFVRFATGEGLEKKNENFAEEVAKQMGQ